MDGIDGEQGPEGEQGYPGLPGKTNSLYYPNKNILLQVNMGNQEAQGFPPPAALVLREKKVRGFCLSELNTQLFLFKEFLERMVLPEHKENADYVLMLLEHQELKV